ncbi:MAG: L,D-transpeptidase family protein [Rhodospirillales bacterium]|nr:L,D-transpeptidase family protein [Rhodospirillales bacterium]
MTATGDIVVTPDRTLTFGGRRYTCAIGRSGIVQNKREGDGGTPLGSMELRHVYFRADRIAKPATALPVTALGREDGWCDDPGALAYNTFVHLPYPARCEELWRTDSLYDIIVVLGWNDDPVKAGRGSAIFLHVARPGYAPTEGCAALTVGDLLTVLADCGPQTRLIVKGA